MSTWFQKNNFADEKDRQSARILSTLILTLGGVYLFVIVISMLSRNWTQLAVALAGCALLSVPLGLLGRKKLIASSFVLVLCALGTVTAITMVGQGIRDIGVVAFPIVLIFAGLTLNKILFRICVGLALASVCWLALGEIYGCFTTIPFYGIMQTWIILISATVLFLVAALAVELLATNMRNNLARAENEIAQRKQAEEKLRESEEKYRTVIETTGTGFIILDRQGNILDANQVYVRLTGCNELREILGRHITEWTAAHEKQRNTETVAQCVLHREIKNLVMNYIDNNGRITPVEINATVHGQGESLRIIALCRDISERKHQEEALQNIRKLESLGLIAGGIAHNFNNLMGGIFGFIEMASGSSKEEKVLRYLSKAGIAIERAKGLTAQLLTFAKGGGPVQINTSLIPFIQDTAQITLSRLNILCKFDIANNLWPCPIDKIQIAQVLDNILINAQEAVPQSGSIDLTAKNQSLEENKHPTLAKGNYVKISIKDDGIGIERENLSRIFDPFFTTKRVGQGLGLAMCHSIINRHGGAIDIESEPGKGSTFHIYLPVSSEVGSSSIIKSAPMNLEGRGTFLIMDDEEVLREITTEMLESLGYSVVSKDNGRDTVDCYIEETKAAHSFTGLILDLTIPRGMGGKATVAEIRKLNSEIPIFLASGYADDPVVKNPTEYGFTASICKPFKRAELSEMLNKHLKTY